MKKTNVKFFFANIKTNIVSFIAILAFSFFAVALFGGVNWSGSSIKKSYANEIKTHKLYDISLTAPMGFTEEEVSTVKSVDKVTYAEGGYTAFDKFKDKNGVYTYVKVCSIQENVNFLYSVEGQMPTCENEIAFEKKWAKQNNISIGDSFDFDGYDEEIASNLKFQYFTGYSNSLKKVNYKVTALVESPLYINTVTTTYETDPFHNIYIDGVVFANNSSFAKQGQYQTLYVYSEFLNQFDLNSSQYNEQLELLERNVSSSLVSSVDAKYQNISIFKNLIPNFPERDKLSPVLSNRFNNPSYVTIETINSFLGNFSISLTIPFIVVGILISFSTILRTINKNKKNIGTLQALGMNNSAISRLYIMFSLTATIFGLIGGLLASRFIILPVVISSIGKTFIITKNIYSVSLLGALLVCVIEIIGAIVSSIIAIASVLKIPTLDLLSGKEEKNYKKHFFEKFKWWNKLSLFNKSTIKNFSNDRKRAFATFIGVLASTMLVICGITLINSSNRSFNKEFEDYQHFSYIVFYDSSVSGIKEDIQLTLDQNNIKTANIYSQTAYLIDENGDSTYSKMFVSNDNFNKMIECKDQNGNIVNVGNGVFINNAAAKSFKIDVNEEVKFVASSNSYTAPCGGIYEYFLQTPLILMNEEDYVEYCGNAPDYNAFIVSSKDISLNNLYNLLSSKEGFLTIQDYYARNKQTADTITIVVFAISFIYILLSALLAIFMLFDLIVMFIREKKIELLTMILNGYKTKKVKKYIYQDTIILTTLGLIAGVFAGIILGIYNVSCMQTKLTYYMLDVDPFACIIGVAYISLVTFIVSIISLKKIDNFALTDISGS